MPNGPNRFAMATNPLHFLASRTQAQAFRAGVGRWMRRREFFTGMYTFLAHKAKNGISDQCLEHIAGFAGLPQEDRRLVPQAGVAGSRWVRGYEVGSSLTATWPRNSGKYRF